jgi:hypothetical protein
MDFKLEIRRLSADFSILYVFLAALLPSGVPLRADENKMATFAS